MKIYGTTEDIDSEFLPDEDNFLSVEDAVLQALWKVWEAQIKGADIQVTIDVIANELLAYLFYLVTTE